MIAETLYGVVAIAFSLSLSLVTHILISVVFRLASRKSTALALAKATILCLDVVASAVGGMVSLGVVLRSIEAGKQNFWFLVFEELYYSPVTIPIYILILHASMVYFGRVILTTTITILRTPFVEQGLLYSFFSYSSFSYRACLQSRLVWIPSVNAQYREVERIHEERASHYLTSLEYTNEESHQDTF